MNLTRAYTRCAAALTALGITSFASAAYNTSETAPLLALIGLPAALIAWWLAVRGLFLLPRWLVNTLLFLAVVYALFRATSGIDVEAIAELVVFIQIIKIGDRRSPRDDAQILSLAVFLAIAAMLTSNAFWVGVQLIAFVPLLIATVMLFQLYSGWFAAHHAAAGTGQSPSSLGRQLRRTVGFATFASAVAAVLVFIMMPRGIGENALGTWRPRMLGSVSGFTTNVKLGSRSIVNVSQKIVMDVLFRDPTVPSSDPSSNLGSANTVFYLRGAVLNQYQDGAWTSENDSEEKIPCEPRTAGGNIAIGSITRSSLVEQVVTVHSIAEAPAPLFAIWRPIDLYYGKGTSTILLDRSVATMRRVGTPGQYEYIIRSADNEVVPEPAERTPASFDSRPIRELAAKIMRAGSVDPDPAARPIGDDLRAAHLLELYLQQNYAYTLIEQVAPAGRDPIEYFLFESKEGHCEYFAAALTALCRSVGVNARMVAGYVAAEFNETTGRYTVREANAHAWVEAEAGVGRWRRYDATPPADLERLHKPQPGLLTRLRRAVESAEYAWNASVVSFDQEARQRLLGPEDEVRGGFLTRLDVLTERIRLAGPRHFLRAAINGAAVFLGVATIGLLIQLAFLVVPNIRWWPRRLGGRASLAPAGIDPAQLRFYRRLLDVLARRGHPKPAWRPPLDHARAIAAGDAPLADGAARLAALYYRVRFGGRPLSEAELADARSMLDGLARQGPPPR